MHCRPVQLTLLTYLCFCYKANHSTVTITSHPYTHITLQEHCIPVTVNSGRCAAVGLSVWLSVCDSPELNRPQSHWEAQLAITAVFPFSSQQTPTSSLLLMPSAQMHRDGSMMHPIFDIEILLQEANALAASLLKPASPSSSPAAAADVSSSAPTPQATPKATPKAAPKASFPPMPSATQLKVGYNLRTSHCKSAHMHELHIPV